jgi:hypothetical protein
MKRCPDCNFVYLDSDHVCDMDGSNLVSVEDRVDEASDKQTAKRVEGWKWLALVAVLGTALGAVVFVVYHRFTRHDLNAANSTAAQTTSTVPINSSLVLETATPVPESSPTPAPKASVSPRPTSTKLSSNPVSTTTNQAAPHGVTIRLTDGGTISADEAWSTKEGIWFRRAGVVTLIKRNRVKAIDRNQ